MTIPRSCGGFLPLPLGPSGSPKGKDVSSWPSSDGRINVFILATVRDYDIVFFPGTLEVLCHEICLLVHRDPRCYVASLFARSSRV